MAVSYTHLDVYKRQGQSYTVRLTSDGSLTYTGVSLNVTYGGACTPAWTNGTGGSGGGSNGESGVNGTANTGGGGGAETAGGSGVVVIRYPAGSWRSGNNSIATCLLYTSRCV